MPALPVLLCVPPADVRALKTRQSRSPSSLKWFSGVRLNVTLKVNGAVVASGRVPAAMTLHFTGGNETLDVGSDMGSPVSLDYFDLAPFAFNVTIGTTTIKYSKKQ